MTHSPVALITGAGSTDGIGFATAIRLATSGYRVMLTGHSERVHNRATELVAMGHSAISFAGDLTDPDTRQDFGTWVADGGGQLDAVVCSKPSQDPTDSHCRLKNRR